MRFDYYERFGPQWQYGFEQLRKQGRFFSEARHAHAVTETGPGHATLATGTHPSRHGIVSNRWYDRVAKTKVGAVDDAEAKILGAPEREEGASPAALLRTGVGDWAQEANPEAVVISMSLKDRAAILMGGKQPDLAVWYDDELGAFTSSTHYAEALPAWIAEYNHKDRAKALVGEAGWTLSRAESEYGDSRMKTRPELVSTFNDYALTKTFPHAINQPDKAPRNVIRDTPFGDQMTLELAREAIEAESMGADGVPDLLLISLSAGDYTGHRYGPQSVEIHDYYLRLDEQLGEFIAWLDERFKADELVLVLSSDHGVSPMPEYAEFEHAGRFVAGEELPPMLKAVAEQLKLEPDERPELVFSHGVDLVFDEAVSEAERRRVRAALAEQLRGHDKVADAWTRDELAAETERGEFSAQWRRSHHAERSPDVQIQRERAVASYPQGTGHGTPYEYDRHVPLIIRGAGEPGRDERPAQTVDLAPTIAALIGVPVPEGVDGQNLLR